MRLACLILGHEPVGMWHNRHCMQCGADLAYGPARLTRRGERVLATLGVVGFLLLWWAISALAYALTGVKG